MSKPFNDLPLNKDLYEVLEVPRDATPEQIKERYRKLVLKYHPDKNRSEEATDRFREIHEAYQVLSDSDKRFLYDRYGDDYTKIRKSSTFARLIAEVIIELTFSSFVPFDTISKRSKATRYSNPNLFQVFRKIRAEEGWRGLWRGNLLSITNSIFHAHLRDSLTQDPSQSSSPIGPLVASSIALLLSYPFDLICTALRSGKVKSVWEGLVSVWNHNGILGLYSGLTPYILQQVAFYYGSALVENSSLNNWLETKLRRFVEDKSIGTAFAVKMAIIFAKIAAITLITCPLKTLAVRMQLQSLEPSFVGQGVVQMLPNLVRNEGVGKLYSGYLADVIFGGSSILLNSFN